MQMPGCMHRVRTDVHLSYCRCHQWRRYLRTACSVLLRSISSYPSWLATCIAYGHVHMLQSVYVNVCSCACTSTCACHDLALDPAGMCPVSQDPHVANCHEDVTASWQQAVSVVEHEYNHMPCLPQSIMQLAGFIALMFAALWSLL